MVNRQVRRSSTSRRAFLGTAGTIALTPLAPWIIPSAALGADGTIAPSNRITLGFIGVGFMGQKHHLSRFVEYPEAQVLAVCDVDRWRREHGQRIVETAYAGQRASGVYRGCAGYNDLRELLSRDDIDAVVIATGDRWHGAATVMAAQAGKDVYVEKPMSLTIAEGRAMVEAVRRYGRVCQVGLQQRSATEFQLACRLVREGALGKIERIYVVMPGVSREVDLPAEPVPEGLDWDLWLGPAPWRPFNRRFHQYGEPKGVVPWNLCRDFGGGLLTSNDVHAFDVVQWALGMDHAGPVDIVPPETGEYPSLTYRYPSGVLVHVVEGRLDPKKHVIPKGWDPITSIQNFGAVFVGERGWIHVGRSGYLTSFPSELAANGPGRYDRFVALQNHHRDWLDAIATRRRPACDAAIGCQSTIVAHLGCIASWTGRALKWDPAQEQFLGDDEANRMLGRSMREPWRV
jgi:predicted dehydrogenase